MKMKTVIVVYIADGYLAAAADAADVWGEGYWGPRVEGCLQDEDGFTTRRCRLPEELAEQVKRQGRSDQHFSDGYDAANAVATFYAERKAKRS
jgi:hypothetical protein